MWELGWEALVALGTVGLAGATVYLAWSTRRVAETARDEQAAAWRPILLPVQANIARASGQWAITVLFRNDGRGPALDLQPQWMGVQGEMPIQGRPVAVGEAYNASIDVEDSSAERKVTVSYRDLGGRGHRTEVTIIGPGALGGICKVVEVNVEASR